MAPFWILKSLFSLILRSIGRPKVLKEITFEQKVPTFEIIKEHSIQFVFFGPKDSKSAPAPFPAQLEGPPQNLTPPSAHLSSTKAAAQKKAKNATMCLALNVQWGSHSIAAMLRLMSAIMR